MNFPEAAAFNMYVRRTFHFFYNQSRRAVLFLIVAILISACLPALETGVSATSAQPVLTRTPAPAAATVYSTPEVYTPLYTPSQSPTHSSLPGSSPSVEPAWQVCEQAGQVITKTLPGESPGQSLTFNAYLPPCYVPDSASDYPTVILIHGQGYEPSQWLEIGLVEKADRLVLSGQIPAVIILMPLEQNDLLEPEQSDFDNQIMDVMLPWAHENLSACIQPACAGIGGISRGGAWALRIGLENPDHFGMIGMHSAPAFASDHYRLPVLLKETAESSRPELAIDAGESDIWRRYIVEFHENLTHMDIDHAWRSAPGGHDNAYWEAHLETYLFWYGGTLKNDSPESRLPKPNLMLQ